MKILVLSPTLFEYPVRVGGAERYVSDLSMALSNHSSVSKVTTVGFNGHRFDQTVSSKFSIHSYDTFFRGNQFNPFLNPRVLLHHDWDVLYLHQFYTWLTPSAVLWAKALRRKVALTDHNGGGPTYNRQLGLDRRIDLFLATSKISLDDTALEAKANGIIYGGADQRRFMPPENENGRRGFLFVGRAHPIKGLDALLEAASRANVDDVLTLVLWVDGTSQNYLRTLRDHWEKLRPRSKMRVEFVVNPPGDSIVTYYQSSAWTVLPSLDKPPRECLGLVLFEALACGSGAASSRHTGVSELALQYPSAAFKIVDDWKEFFETAERRQETAGAARDWASKHATWDRVAERAVTHFQHLLVGGS